MSPQELEEMRGLCGVASSDVSDAFCCGADAGSVFSGKEDESSVERGVVEVGEQAWLDVFAELFGGVGERLCAPKVVFCEGM